MSCLKLSRKSSNLGYKLPGRSFFIVTETLFTFSKQFASIDLEAHVDLKVGSKLNLLIGLNY